MTIICFDGNTLAADKRAGSGNTFVTVTKIFKIKKNLVGIAGDYSYARLMLEWFRAGAKIEAYPESKDDNIMASMLVIDKDKTIWLYEDGPHPFKVEDGHCAIGCGEEAGRVAMACGLSARDAVLMASRFNSGCGNGVDEIRHDKS